MNRPLATLYEYLEKPQRMMKYSRSWGWGLNTRFPKQNQNNNYYFFFASSWFLLSQISIQMESKHKEFKTNVCFRCMCVCVCTFVCVFPMTWSQMKNIALSSWSQRRYETTYSRPLLSKIFIHTLLKTIILNTLS